ncbi:TolC family protein [Geomonas sp. RF6]|uniref:TolC family protein n=1 Tax=Geomonas sp. RF6 TaxID=2897342 RepID=UPI001E61A81D|nr:TolC family protein [Geomonas sp. RF6]UFS72226.1 TolC family protein [Geomonas sp. RF6]
MGRTAFTRRVLFLAPILVPVFSLQVQGEAQGGSLPQVIEYSLQNNGELQAYRQEKEIREAGKVKARLLPNPTLDLEAGTGALSGSEENNLELGISQEFLLWGKKEKRLAVAERDLDLYRWQVAERERGVREEVALAYYDVLAARERVSLGDRSIALSRQLLDVAKERLQAGDIPELEMNLVKVEVGRSEGVRLEAARDLLQKEARLASLSGAPGAGEAAPYGKLEDGIADMPKPLAELKLLARERRPDLKVLDAERRRGEAEISLARAERIPNLTAGLALRRDTTTMEIGGVEGKETAYTVALRFSVPLPVFDKNQAALQEARGRRNSSETRLTAAARNVEREVGTAYAAFENATSVLSLYKGEIIPQLEENVKLTQEAYRLGEVGILSIIEEQRKFFEVSEGYLAALHARQTAFVRLMSASASDLTGGEK